MQLHQDLACRPPAQTCKTRSCRMAWLSGRGARRRGRLRLSDGRPFRCAEGPASASETERRTACEARGLGCANVCWIVLRDMRRDRRKRSRMRDATAPRCAAPSTSGTHTSACGRTLEAEIFAEWQRVFVGYGDGDGNVGRQRATACILSAHGSQGTVSMRTGASGRRAGPRADPRRPAGTQSCRLAQSARWSVVVWPWSVT